MGSNHSHVSKQQNDVVCQPQHSTVAARHRRISMQWLLNQVARTTVRDSVQNEGDSDHCSHTTMLVGAGSGERLSAKRDAASGEAPAESDLIEQEQMLLNRQRFPHLELSKPSPTETNTQDWRWLSIQGEKTLEQISTKRQQASTQVAEALGKSFDIEKFSCFVPRTVMEAVADKRIRYTDNFDIIIEKFVGTVVFCDTSGFTALTEALDRQPNGAEKLGECINNYFTPLIQIVNFWGGDIIKFSGDALTIVWPVDDDEASVRHYDPSSTSGIWSSSTSTGTCNSYKIDRRQAIMLACQCCLDLHSNLGNFPTPVPGKYFTLHIGVGFGSVTILQVGGTLNRWEYVVCGPPLRQIAIAEPLATSGETVLSPAAIVALGDDNAELEYIESEDGKMYAKLISIKDVRPTPPPPLERIPLQDSDVNLLKRFIPPAVFKRLAAGYSVFINELRRVSVGFLGVHGLDVSTERGSQLAHELMKLTQRAAYCFEGSVNKFLVDDKGVLILIMFGIPPVHHLDDPIRACFCALRIVDGLKALDLSAGIGVATGHVWCGTVGCELRKEYTAMGDTVNLSARLMGKAARNEINVDLNTKLAAEDVLEFRALDPVKMKGKTELVPMFQPTGYVKRRAVLQTTKENNPICDWAEWKYRKKITRLILPKYRLRSPVVGLDYPPLDFAKASNPLLPWEIVEPWSPTLTPIIDLGGVVCIKGLEGEGTSELAAIIRDLSERKLHRRVFLCSNMPDSIYINIGNVPLLAWRKLCSEMVQRWRLSRARESKEYPKVDRDNSVLGHVKELVHPLFHWRLSELQDVISGLVIDDEVPLLLELEKKRNSMQQCETGQGGLESIPNVKSGRASQESMPSNMQMPCSSAEIPGSGTTGKPTVRDSIRSILGTNFLRSVTSKFSKSSGTSMSNLELPTESGEIPPIEKSMEGGDGEPSLKPRSTVAPLLSSLVNGYSMYEPTVLVLHVRQGTCFFATMDPASWEVARLIAQIAMMRRKRKIEVDMKDLKRWRRRHSRLCDWCKGLKQPYLNLAGEVVRPLRTGRCCPPPSRYFPPLIFILICSDASDGIAEQQQIITWARQCGSYIPMRRLTPTETASYLAHCLKISAAALPDGLVEYAHRVSSGIPEYISLTAHQLVRSKAIIANVALSALSKPSLEPQITSFETTVLNAECEPEPEKDTEVVWQKKNFALLSGKADTSPLEMDTRSDYGSDSTSTDEARPLPTKKARMAGQDSVDAYWRNPTRDVSNLPDPLATMWGWPTIKEMNRFPATSTEQLSLIESVKEPPYKPHPWRRGPQGLNNRMLHIYEFDPTVSSVLRQLFPVDVRKHLVELANGTVALRQTTKSERNTKRRLRGKTGGNGTNLNPVRRSAEQLSSTEISAEAGSTAGVDSLGTELDEIVADMVKNRGRYRCYIDPLMLTKRDLTNRSDADESDRCGDMEADDTSQGGQVVEPRGVGTLSSSKREKDNRVLERTEVYAPCENRVHADALMETRDQWTSKLRKVASDRDGKVLPSLEAFHDLCDGKQPDSWTAIAETKRTDVRTRPRLSAAQPRRRTPSNRRHRGLPKLKQGIFLEAFVPPGPNVFSSENAKARFVTTADHPTWVSSWEVGEEERLTDREVTRKDEGEPLVDVRVSVVRDLRLIPFVPELRAAAMSLMEMLEPDEQLAAKVASVFPVPFTSFELQAVFPRVLPQETFDKLIEHLLNKNMIETCCPPTPQENSLLQFHLAEHEDDLDTTVMSEAQNQHPFVIRLTANDETASQRGQEVSDSFGSMSRSASRASGAALGDEDESASSPVDEQADSNVRFFSSGERSRSMLKQLGNQDDDLQLPNAMIIPGRHPKTLKQKRRDARWMRPPKSNFEWGIDEKTGSPVFYRFTSISFQHFVSELLLSDEKRFLAHISRKIIALRQTHSVYYLMHQVVKRQKKLEGSTSKRSHVSPRLTFKSSPPTAAIQHRESLKMMRSQLMSAAQNEHAPPVTTIEDSPRTRTTRNLISIMIPEQAGSKWDCLPTGYNLMQPDTVTLSSSGDDLFLETPLNPLITSSSAEESGNSPQSGL